MMSKWSQLVIGASLTFALTETDSLAQTSGECSLAAPVVVASGLQAPANPHVDDRYVYFFGFGPFGLWRVDKSGGTPAELAVYGNANNPDPAHSFDLAVDDENIYVMFPGVVDLDPRPGAVIVYDKTGAERYAISAQSTRPDDRCYIEMLSHMAVAPTGDIYWIQSDHLINSDCREPENSAIGRVPAGATEGTILIGNSGFARHILADAFHVFWEDDDGIYRLPGDGQGNREILTGPGVTSMAIDADNLYHSLLIDADHQFTFRLFAPQEQDRISNSAFFDLRTDGTFVYGNVLRTGPGAAYNLFRVKPNGHGLYNLAKGGGSGLAVDDTYIYYFDATSSSLMKTCKLAGL